MKAILDALAESGNLARFVIMEENAHKYSHELKNVAEKCLRKGSLALDRIRELHEKGE